MTVYYVQNSGRNDVENATVEQFLKLPEKNKTFGMKTSLINDYLCSARVLQCDRYSLLDNVGFAVKRQAVWQLQP